MTDQEYNEIASKLSKASSIKTAIQEFVEKRDGALASSKIKLVFLDDMDTPLCTTHIYQKEPDGGLNPDCYTILKIVANAYNSTIDDMQAEFESL